MMFSRAREDREEWREALESGGGIDDEKDGDGRRRSAATRADAAEKERAASALAQGVGLTAEGAGASSKAQRPALSAFLSSTFTDTEVERNLLIADVYPYLKKFGRRVGVEFLQPSEMRWGIRSSAADEHATAEICMAEVARCRTLSSGISYVLILGDKFGFARVPAAIEATELDELAAHIAMSDSSSAALIEEWFRLDTNAVPPTYLMRELRADDNRGDFWGRVYPGLRTALRTAADKVLKDDEVRRDYYYLSVTEEEIHHGLLDVPLTERPEQAFIFHREISDIDDVAADDGPDGVSRRLLGNFVDLDADGNHINEEARERLVDVVTQTVLAEIPSTSVKEYQVNFDPASGISTAKHAEYLKQFADDFCRVMMSSMTSIARSARAAASAQDPLLREISSHAVYARSRAQVFTLTSGSEAVLDGAQTYLSSEESQTPPFAVVGESGSGKTSVMAQIMVTAKQEYPDAVVVARFVGTTASSSTGRLLLESLCDQIVLGCGLDEEEGDGEEKQGRGAASFADVVARFLALLARVAADENKASPESDTASPRLILILDALDQLSNDDNARESLAWLPRLLPSPVVKIIVSTLPDDPKRNLGVVSALHKRGIDDLVKVSKLDEKSARDLLRGWLKHVGRTCTAEQEALVVDRTMAGGAKTRTPLFMNIAFNLVRRWHSFTETSSVEHTMRPTVQEMIEALFQRVRLYNGDALVDHALAFVTLARDGLSTNDLEDLISMDDHVLDQVFEWWTPPVKRLPPLLWTRITDDLSGYLVSRGTDDGTTVLAWFHRQFRESQEASLGTQPELVQTAHEALAAYFDSYEATASRATVAKERKVQEQPLYLEDGRINSRKVRMLPYHLQKAGHIARLREVLVDLDFAAAALALDLGFEIVAYWRDLEGGLGEAERAYQAALEQRRANGDLGPAQLRTVAQLMKQMGLYASAAGALKESVNLLQDEASHSSDGDRGQVVRQAREVELGETLLALADILNLSSEYDSAEEAYREARKKLEDQHKNEIPALVGLGEMFVHMGRYEEARELFETALPRAEERFGPESLVVARVCDKLSSLLRTRARFDKNADPESELTESFARRGLDIREKVLGRDHIDYADSCMNMARFLLGVPDAEERIEETREFFAEAKRVKGALLGPDHPDFSQVLYNLAKVEGRLGNFEEAEHLYDQALAGWRKSLGDDHPFIATGQEAKAFLLIDLGRYEEARRCLEECIAVRKAKFGDQHPRYIAAVETLRDLDKKDGGEGDNAANAADNAGDADNTGDADVDRDGLNSDGDSDHDDANDSDGDSGCGSLKTRDLPSTVDAASASHSLDRRKPSQAKPSQAKLNAIKPECDGSPGRGGGV
ncbi:Kinesin light chain 3 [Hondaea fermentalgiana]|uniref:Kinesin light chain 3 n=1 Tax=Hondaea fermentalgiana TaxID=2315210 RepID=A0A2R5GDD0_9STRA|nr:Kinesin light chain 3 [Hondaea fermentalgiana]|eukprot:GBG26643.1 Kinesin light chain 3 [Hondaea fermentalgiana]